MFKRFLAIAALTTTSAGILIPTVFSTPDSTQAVAQVTSVSELSDVQPARDEIRGAYKGVISSDKLDVLRKDPKTVLRKAGIKVQDDTKIKFVDGNDDSSAKKRKVVIIITDKFIIIIIK
ncbi:MAG: hypothetical protein AAF378_06630 [Cyanobacteria bacterium P01_A01_bin.84]